MAITGANRQVLADELSNDPLSRGYSTMTDEEAAADLETAYRTGNRASLSGDEIFQQTVPAEFGALTDHRQSLWLSFCGRSEVDPFASNNVEFVRFVFGTGSQTESNLGAARTQPITRSTELGLPTVRTADVTRARNAS